MRTGRRYKSKKEGLVWRTVRCQHCGCEFAYKLLISATGEGFSWMCLDNDGAIDRARYAAGEDFDKQVRNSIAPCPDCGKYQANMVQEIRNEGVGLGIVVLVIALVLTIAHGGIFDESWFTSLVWVIALPIMGYCTWWKFFHDPNANIDPQKPYKSEHTVLRRRDFELLAQQIKQKEGKDVPIPVWPR